MGYLLVTHDIDFLRLNAEGFPHAGIAFAPHTQADIGGLLRELRALRARLTAEEAVGQVFFLRLK
jgi:hypothetical protein